MVLHDMDEKYTELAIRVEGIDARCKSNEHRIDDHDSDIKELKEDTKTLIRLTNNVETIANSVADVNKKVDIIGAKQDRLNDKVTILENRPANETKKRWDSISMELLKLFIVGIAGFLLAQVLPEVF